ncbi:MAG: hypothetical protein OEZ06_08055 [Myxococcales bacterium]|nr:hypothetical protein [Myxococcales bacterium]
MKLTDGSGSLAPAVIERAAPLGSAIAGLLVAAAFFAACASPSPGLLSEDAAAADPARSSSPDGAGGTPAGAGGMAAAAPDASLDSGPTSQPVAGGDSSGTGGSGGTTAPAVGCVPNPDPDNEVCREICPEACNDRDDDCDLRIDEGEASDDCSLDNATSACSRGECLVVACDAGFRDCDFDPSTGCESPEDDVDNCGVCGNRCQFVNAIAACVSGQCEASACVALYDNCDGASDDCETAVNTLSNCGACGLSCTSADVPNATPSCERGFCGVAACVGDFGDCNQSAGDGCEQSLNTTDHCGGCNVLCDLPGSIDDDCSSGTCAAGSCEIGYEDCNGDPTDGCESLDSSQHCGACGATCDVTLSNVSAASCNAGVCQISCADGFGDCDGDPSTGCEAALNTVGRCGSCDVACSYDNAVAACDAGVCVLQRCSSGFDNCDGDDTDGCETSLNADITCGSCGNDCTASGLPVCSGGSCSAVSCPDPNTADCNKDGLPCEVDLLTDASHCGACGAACQFTTATPHASGLVCAVGLCQPVCDAGYDDCDGDPENGCETALDTLSDCGSCGVACSIANASATCATGSCRVATCAVDFDDCDGDGKSCEQSLATAGHCGSCGNACMLDNAVPSCGGSPGARSCQVSSCQEAYFENCDGQSGNGCEIDTRSSTGDCGSCGFDCSAQAQVASASCTASSCQFTCSTGYADCNSLDDDGCETATTTLSDCGDCGVGCSRSNGSASCATGSCELTGCDTGFDDCDANPDNGCEPLNTVTNCGACDAPCLPFQATGDCSTQSCEIGSCNADWDDCDMEPSTGCEHQISVLGPCVPDTNCLRAAHGGHVYFFCQNARTWADARSHCAAQLLGELVRIDDAAENDFVRSNLVATSWIGASDSTTEGQWRWNQDDAQFWMGTSSGGAVSGLYNNWNAGEPNDSGGEDCAQMYGDGTGVWNDQPCGDSFDFVCEVQQDQCPDDPDKYAPGQCGCGFPDTDGDVDGTADCVDGCPADGAKTAPGQCGCGAADTDGDVDGVADCVDGCPADASKTAAGTCGCGSPDIDSDSDGVLDCLDACPFSSVSSSPPCGFDYLPSNFDATSMDFSTAPDSLQDCAASIVIDTGDPVTFTNYCGLAPTPVIVGQIAGPDAVVLPLSSLTIAAGTTLRVVGSRPLIFAVNGNVNIDGTLSARAIGPQPGAGGNISCSAGIGGGDADDLDSGDGGGGGGGGGFAVGGGGGGNGNRGASGRVGGGVEGNPELIPLRGGCPGGRGGYGGRGTNGGRLGGGGGGAVQISAAGEILVRATGAVTAGGGGAQPGADDEDGGGGGGSGGAILLEAGTVTTESGAWLTAGGGGGAAGNETSSPNGNPGTDGLVRNTARAPGGTSPGYGGDGGQGGAQAGAATNGGAGDCNLLCLSAGAGGGGGGGGIGRIRINAAYTCTLAASTSPGISTSCP